MKFLISCILILLLISSVQAEVCFQDNTFRNSLRLCNTSGSCVILSDSNCTDMTNIAYCSNIGGDKLEDYSVFDDVMNHQNLWILFIFVGSIIVGIVVWIFKKKK